jgi:homocitrate synthase NifV
MEKQFLEIPMSDRVVLIDTTLRDGEQGCGIAFSVAAKLKIAGLLYEAGIREIETGVPASYPEECVILGRLRECYPLCRFIAWNRMNRKDILASLVAGADVIHISVPVSGRMMERKLGLLPESLLSKVKEILRFTVDHGVRVTVGAEDASRADESFLIDVMGVIKEEGCERMRYADTVGCQYPSLVVSIMTRLMQAVPLPLEYHSHNDLGLAVANALAAVEAGVRALSVTVCGIGERAGNAALETVVAGIRLLYGKETGIDPERLPLLARIVAAYSNRVIEEHAPIVGRYAFCHESGIHVDGILKDPGMYTFVPAFLFGRSESIVPGKNSGTRALAWCARRLGYELSGKQLIRLKKLVYLRWTSGDKRKTQGNDFDSWKAFSECLEEFSI